MAGLVGYTDKADAAQRAPVISLSDIAYALPGNPLIYNSRPIYTARQTMRALLVVAHGSRREASNDEVRQLTDHLRALAGDEFVQVECAFLELAEPSIPDGIDCCIAEGAREVVILPYFLSAGRHVVTDIPEIVSASQTRHPDVSLRIAPYLGRAPNLVTSLLELSNI